MNSNPQRCLAFALLTTLLLITLLTAVASQLVTATSTEALVSRRRQQTLAHQLARDSAMLVLADRFDPKNPESETLIRELDASGKADVDFKIGEISVTVTIGDDGARLNPNAWPRPDQQHLLERKLRLLARSIRRTERIELQPVGRRDTDDEGIPYVCLDQLLIVEDPGTLYRWNHKRLETSVWSDVVTCWGDGRIDLRRVNRDVLEAALEDIRPGLAETMLATRPEDRSVDFAGAALAVVDSDIRDRIQQRITFNAQRYAVQMTTAIHSDRRRWYLVSTLSNGQWSILHRSAITW